LLNLLVSRVIQFRGATNAARRLALLLVPGAGLLLAGCAALPFGNELARNNAAAHTAAPMPLEATYSPGATSTQATAMTTDVPAPTLRPDPTVTAALPSPAATSAPTADDALLSPDEKAKVIAELEALAKKQGDELNKERAATAAACDNLSATDLRKKLLEGSC